MRGLGPAVERVLAEPSYRAEARRIAAADRATPSAATVVDELLALAAAR